MSSYTPYSLDALQSAVLAIKVKEYYTRLQETLAASAFTREQMKIVEEKKSAATNEIDLIDEEDIKQSLPASWSDLEDHHFPLFLSFDHLCSLLEKAYDVNFTSQGIAAAQRQQARLLAQSSKTKGDKEESVPSAESYMLDTLETANVAVKEVDRSAWSHFVDLDTFIVHYWPHFDQRLTKHFDPSLCYAEFVGVIQGSEESLKYKAVRLQLIRAPRLRTLDMRGMLTSCYYSVVCLGKSIATCRLGHRPRLRP